MNANNQTIFSKQFTPALYSDIPINFDKAPFSNDLARVTNENDIKQSIQNIVLTFLGERLYDNTIGSAIDYQLFELDDALASTMIKKVIIDSLKHNEPRAQIRDVVVNNNPDGNSYSLTIYFTALNNSNLLSTTVILRRIR